MSIKHPDILSGAFIVEGFLCIRKDTHNISRVFHRIQQNVRLIYMLQ